MISNDYLLLDDFSTLFYQITIYFIIPYNFFIIPNNKFMIQLTTLWSQMTTEISKLTAYWFKWCKMNNLWSYDNYNWLLYDQDWLCHDPDFWLLMCVRQTKSDYSSFFNNFLSKIPFKFFTLLKLSSHVSLSSNSFLT